MNFSPETRKMVEYLFGSLTEEERARIQERLFLDDEFCDAMRAAEDDLLDGYVSGRLAESDRSRMEALLRESPARGERMPFARALQRRAKERPSRSRRLVPALGWAMAAVLAAVAVWTGLQIRDLHARLSQTESRLRQVERLNVAPSVAAVVIWPGTLRGEAAPRTFASFVGSELVRLTLPCEALRAGQSATAVLSLEGGAVVWREAALTLRNKEGIQVAEMLVPAGRLEPGSYRLVLRQSPEAVEEYRFRVR